MTGSLKEVWRIISVIFQSGGIPPDRKVHSAKAARHLPAEPAPVIPRRGLPPAPRPVDERTTGHQDKRSCPARRRDRGRAIRPPRPPKASGARPVVLSSFRPVVERAGLRGEAAPAIRPVDDIDDADDIDDPRTEGRRSGVRRAKRSFNARPCARQSRRARAGLARPRSLRLGTGLRRASRGSHSRPLAPLATGLPAGGA